MANAYRQFKRRVTDMVEHRREPKDRPPITMFTLELERPGGGTVEVEGSSRAVGKDLDRFLDSGAALLPVAEAYLRHAPNPQRLAKMHFVHSGDGWVYRYGLDDAAEPVMIVALSNDAYSEAVAEARRNQRSEGKSSGADD